MKLPNCFPQALYPDKIMSQGNMLTIQMLLFMYTGNEKLCKWIVFVVGKFFTVVVEGYL